MQWRNPSNGARGQRDLQVRCDPTYATEIALAKGTLAVTVKPWADVFLGSAKLGTTPLPARSLYEGEYELKLVNPELGVIRSVKAVVRPGEKTLVRESLLAK